MSRILITLLAFPLFFLSACTQTQLGAHMGKKVYNESKTQGTFKVGNPYNIKGVKYHPKETYNHTETGIASWYGPNFHGKQTANGEIFNKYELTAAHRTLQMPSLIEVTNLENGKSVILRVNDRGPFARNRVLDVSQRGAELLGFKNQGTAKVRLTVLKEESHKLAQIAKTGRNTRGMEVAYNEKHRNNQLTSTQKPSFWQRTKGLFSSDTEEVASASSSVVSDSFANPDPFASNAPTPLYDDQLAAPIEMASIEKEVIFTEPAAGNTSFAAKVTAQEKISPSPVALNTHNTNGDIFIQAGAFGDANNARTLSGRLGSIAPANVSSVDINGNMLHRVRLGPFETMAQANSALSVVAANGQNSAMIVVD